MPQSASCVPLERTGQPLALRRAISAHPAHLERALLVWNPDPQMSAKHCVRKANGPSTEWFLVRHAQKERTKIPLEARQPLRVCAAPAEQRLMSNRYRKRTASAHLADTAVRRMPSQSASCVPLERTGQPLALEGNRI